MDFEIERTENGHSTTYRGFGKLYPVPGAYKFEAEIGALLKLVKHKKRDKYELNVNIVGSVSIDRSRELVLESPPLLEERKSIQDDK